VARDSLRDVAAAGRSTWTAGRDVHKAGTIIKLRESRSGIIQSLNADVHLKTTIGQLLHQDS